MRTFEKSNALVAREKKVAPLAAQTFSKSYRYFMPDEAPMYKPLSITIFPRLRLSLRRIPANMLL